MKNSTKQNKLKGKNKIDKRKIDINIDMQWIEFPEIRQQFFLLLFRIGTPYV